MRQKRYSSTPLHAAAKCDNLVFLEYVCNAHPLYMDDLGCLLRALRTTNKYGLWAHYQGDC